MPPAGSSADYVMIGCKMPNGIVLNLDKYEVTNKEQGLVRLVEGGAEVTLKGTARAFGQPDTSINGVAYTRVSRDFWDRWLAEHKDFAPLRDGFILVAKTADEQKKIAREREGERGQFPRLEENDPRTRAIGKIKKFDPKDEGAEAA